ncbi:virulence factor Mce family protein [Amycolatopsis methanolica 239]|uniref:Virulence factor Mce family protein n=1 Tax=Amycolatopsis methanolica 239 TaxID=1068978 RepID=A0A076MU17_AMYME|nr:virulence factor Mce family protein [Amycolatopsis methanolica 239]
MRPRRYGRLLTIVGLSLAFVAGFLYFWTASGGTVPGFTQDGYRVSFDSADTKNLQEQSEVTMAGVKIGQVVAEDLSAGGRRVVLSLTDAAPLHQGVTVRIGVKSVIGQSYVDVVDGQGPPLAEGAALPPSAVIPAVDVDEVISTFDPQTRAALSQSVQSLGAATKGTAESTSQLLSGLGDLGRNGYTALDAIAAQSADLTALTREAGQLLDTLDTGRGRIVSVVDDAHTLATATAGQRNAIESTMRQLPSLLTAANSATGKLGELSVALQPVTTDLRASAPDLNRALLQLPATTNDLRGLLPALNGTLDDAPATLHRVPAVGADVRGLLPTADTALRDLNPALSYLAPYGRDVGAMFASFGASMDLVTENGIRPIRLGTVFDSGTLRNYPVPLTLDPTHWNNAYPAPGKAGDPAPYTGTYPQVQREPR